MNRYAPEFRAPARKDRPPRRRNGCPHEFLRSPMAPARSEDSCRTDGRSAQAGRGGTVLVVEDCVVTRVAISEALRFAGHTVVEAATCREAVRILKTRRVDLAFVDVHLPCDGEGLLAASYARIRQPDAQVLITSGQRRHGFRRTAETLGSFIPKPYRIGQVVEAVQRRLAEHAGCARTAEA